MCRCATYDIRKHFSTYIAEMFASIELIPIVGRRVGCFRNFAAMRLVRLAKNIFEERKREKRMGR